MNQGMNIPGLFLSNTTNTLPPATSTATFVSVEPPPSVFSASHAETPRETMQVFSNGPTTSNDILQQTAHQLASAVTADDSDGSKEDGELTDVSVNVLPANTRKRKAGDFVDNDRSHKIQASYVDPLDAQGQHAMHIVSTLLENGFPMHQLVQDIYGITLARRHQQHSVTASAQGHALSTADGSPQAVGPVVNATKPQAGIDTSFNTNASTKQNAAKMAPRDPLAYKAKLESLKKSLKKTTQPSKSKLATATTKAAASKLDRERLKAKIAALRAENANKASISSNLQKDGTVSASPGQSPLGNASPSTGPVSNKARLTALDLIESSNGSEHSPGPERINFKFPMGVDQEDSMVIEASSSEDEDEEDQVEAQASDKSSDILLGLESNLESLKAQLAARLLKRRQQASPLPAQVEAQTSPMADPIGEVVDPVSHEIASGSSSEPSAEGKIHSNTNDPAPEITSNTNVDPGETSSARSEVVMVGKPDDGEAEEEGDEDDEASGDEDDAPMSIDSGGEPTPVSRSHGHYSVEEETSDSGSVASDGSVSMDISEGSSDDGDETAEDSSDEESESDVGLVHHAEEESEEDYEPEMAGTSEVADDVINEQDMTPTPSNASSRSQSPGDTWRIHPPTSNNTGVTIWHESGATPELSQAGPVVPKTSSTPFVPYESKLRFKRDELIVNPSP